MRRENLTHALDLQRSMLHIVLAELLRQPTQHAMILKLLSALGVIGRSIRNYIDTFVSNLDHRIEIENDRNKIMSTAGKLFDDHQIQICC